MICMGTFKCLKDGLCIGAIDLCNMGIVGEPFGRRCDVSEETPFFLLVECEREIGVSINDRCERE